MSRTTPPPIQDAQEASQQNERQVRRWAGPLLLAVLAAQFGYPITAIGPQALLGFQVVYVSMVAVGIVVAGGNRRLQIITALSGLLYLIFGTWYSLDATQPWRIMLAYLALPFYQGTLCLVLLRFIFNAPYVSRAVIWAACCLYLLIGALFVPVYGLLEVTRPGAFIDISAPDTRVVWQQLIYFSYVTLTTLGYGDVMPVDWWARAAANLESVIGVLYIAILVGRLVGVYGSERGRAQN